MFCIYSMSSVFVKQSIVSCANKLVLVIRLFSKLLSLLQCRISRLTGIQLHHFAHSTCISILNCFVIQLNDGDSVIVQYTKLYATSIHITLCSIGIPMYVGMYRQPTIAGLQFIPSARIMFVNQDVGNNFSFLFAKIFHYSDYVNIFCISKDMLQNIILHVDYNPMKVGVIINKFVWSI